MSILRWEDPPPTPHGHHLRRRAEAPDVWAATAAALRARKGCWAVIAEIPNAGSASSVASYVNCGRSTSWWPAGAFEATVRKGAGTNTVYARYLGDGGS